MLHIVCALIRALITKITVFRRFGVAIRLGAAFELIPAPGPAGPSGPSGLWVNSSPGRPVDTGRWECDSAMRHRAGGGWPTEARPCKPQTGNQCTTCTVTEWLQFVTRSARLLDKKGA